MLERSKRIDLVAGLAELIEEDGPRLREIITEAGWHNPWFTSTEVRRALQSLRHGFLDKEALNDWAAQYRIPAARESPKTIGLVMAGNIPLVGFHDWLSVFISGHKALIRLSEKDSCLLPFLLEELVSKEPAAAEHWQIASKLKGMDAVIATGSNNSARYFKAYFGALPHIIRQNRNALAVIHGDESDAELAVLMEDIFPYFGLGCRNVSALRLPKGFEITRLLDAAETWSYLLEMDRYRNNYDYQCALLLLNRSPFLQGTCLLLREDPSLLSPISTVHYQWYDDTASLADELQRREPEIQCLVSVKPINGWVVIPPGTSQQPSLTDYADGEDTMAFLNQW